MALGRTTDVRQALRACGLYDPDGPDIDPAIRRTIENSIEDGAFHFSVVTDGI